MIASGMYCKELWGPHWLSHLMREQRDTAWHEKDQKFMGGCNRTLLAGLPPPKIIIKLKKRTFFCFTFHICLVQGCVQPSVLQNSRILILKSQQSEMSLEIQCSALVLMFWHLQESSWHHSQLKTPNEVMEIVPFNAVYLYRSHLTALFSYSSDTWFFTSS